MIIYLPAPVFLASSNQLDWFFRKTGAGRASIFMSAACDDTRGSSGPAALPLFCLAPHGVFPASRIASQAVSSYLAFSPLPVLCCQRTGGIFSVTLSVTAVFQLKRPRVLRGMPPYGVRTFLQQVPQHGTRQRSSAIGE